MRVVLEITKSDQAEEVGRRIAFERSEAFVVGRQNNERVQFRIPHDTYFSRYHMIIEICPPQCFIRDIGSKNGTFVNKEKTREARLQDGDIIRGGHTEMRVHIAAEARDQAAAEAKSARRRRAGAGVGMDTTIDGRRPDLAAGGEIRCLFYRQCGHTADASYLKDFTATRTLAFVCDDCCVKHKDAAHPVPNYEKLGVLGSGALGPVFKARRVSTGTLAALKVLMPELATHPQGVKLFLREMQLAARLKHPQIVPVIEIGQAGKDL